MRTLWAIADIHLAIAHPEKSMESFGDPWPNYVDKLREGWISRVGSDDIVIIAGDISWAMKLSDAKTDLDFIDSLPGKKIIIKGNHDYWWDSNAKMQKILPPSISFIHNTALHIDGIGFGGTRLWDVPGLDFSSYIEWKELSFVKKDKKHTLQAEDLQLFEREKERLIFSLQKIDPSSKIKIAITHYPPIDPLLTYPLFHEIFLSYGITHVVFGHLHSLKKGLSPFFGNRDGIEYHFVAADYLNFLPKPIADIPYEIS